MISATYLNDLKTAHAERLGYTSLVGYSWKTPFPHNSGNYFSLMIDSRSYEIANFWWEDLEHLIQTGVVTFPIMCKILDDRWAIIYDDRVPENYYSETSYRAPQKYWSMKQLMARQKKQDSGELEIVPYADGSGQMETYRVKSQPRKLSGEWTLQESKPEITLSEDAVMAFTLALAKSIDTSTPIPKNSPGRKEANDMAERQNGK
jgi:hypothetical protein